MNNVSASRLLPAVVGGVLSFVIGSYMLSVSHIVVPSEGAGKIDPPPKKDFPPPPNVEARDAQPPPHFELEWAKAKAGEPRDEILRLKGADSRVELANTVGLLDARGEFTVEMWARVNNPDGTQRFFGNRVGRFYGAAKPSVYGGWECGPQFFDRAWGQLWVNIAGADRDIGGAAGGGFNVTPVWHHVAYVHSANQCVIYIDGRQTLQAGYQAPGPAPSPIDLSIGASPEGDKRTFDGDVRAFRATSKARYQQTFVPPRKFQKDAGSVILLDFSGAGTRIKDLAGNHDGKIVSADWVVGAPPDPDPIPDKLTIPGLRLTGNSFIELANTAGLLDNEFCVEAWIKTPAFAGQRLHLFGDKAGTTGWNLHFNPHPAGDRKWDGMFSIGRKSWFENYELEPLTVYHIAVVREGNSSRVYFNGEPPGGTLNWAIGPSTANFFIGHSPAALPDDDPALPRGEIHAFRASSRARYRGGFIPQQRFGKDAATLILLEFSGQGTSLIDLAGNHDGRITNATWVPGTR